MPKANVSWHGNAPREHPNETGAGKLRPYEDLRTIFAIRIEGSDESMTRSREIAQTAPS